ncbi:MAG: hypothetical protein ACRDLZ_07540 [Gaiellaceae bacterium]
MATRPTARRLLVTALLATVAIVVLVVFLTWGVGTGGSGAG